MRQATVIRISGPREVHPGRTDLFRQSKGLRRTGAVVIADPGIIEGESNFASMEWTGAIIQYWCPPGIDVSVCRCGPQTSLAFGLRERRDAQSRSCDGRVEAEGSRLRIIEPVGSNDSLTVVAECLTNPPVELLNCHQVGIGMVKSI